MTLKELKTSVLALGFENRIESDSALVSFANMALKTIFSECAVTKTVKLYLFSQKPTLVIEDVVHEGGGEESFSLCGKAYSIELIGCGSFSIRCGADEFRYSFDTDGKTFKGFIKGNSSVTFYGEHSYYIKRIAVFESTSGPQEYTIPDADGRMSIDISELYGDFLCFCGLPRDSRGRSVQCISMENGKIVLPAGICGEIYLTYRRSPSPISEKLPDAKIDIDEQYSHLLCLLTASFLCLECEPQNAQHYLSLYQNAISDIKRSNTRSIDNLYCDVVGWAK